MSQIGSGSHESVVTEPSLEPSIGAKLNNQTTMSEQTFEMTEPQLRGLRDAIDKTLSRGSGELSDEQLEGVSGGGSDRITAEFKVGSFNLQISSNGRSYTVCTRDDSAPTNVTCTSGPKRQ
jgi:hypothetical protein